MSVVFQSQVSLTSTTQPVATQDPPVGNKSVQPESIPLYGKPPSQLKLLPCRRTMTLAAPARRRTCNKCVFPTGVAGVTGYDSDSWISSTVGPKDVADVDSL
jgi:hypothetical protein